MALALILIAGLPGAGLIATVAMLVRARSRRPWRHLQRSTGSPLAESGASWSHDHRLGSQR